MTFFIEVLDLYSLLMKCLNHSKNCQNSLFKSSWLDVDDDAIIDVYGLIQYPWRCCPGTQKMLSIVSGVSAMKFRDCGRTYTIHL